MQDFWWNLEIKGVAACTETRLAILPRSELIVSGERWCDGALVVVVDALIARATGGRVKVVFLGEPQATLV
jgi:hypothetical protein